MTGRTCQLCGKPLSRFSVGSGGDFCSREHRNQFRLRLGMDRLQEANKVASLMRRRENARPFPAAQLTNDYKVSPRAAGPFPVPVRQPAMHAMAPRTPALERAAIAQVTRNLRILRPAAMALRSAVRQLEPIAPLARTQSHPILPARSIQFPVRLP